MSLLLLAMGAAGAKDALPLFTEADKRMIVAQYADCVVARHTDEAVTFIQREEDEVPPAILKAISDGKCLARHEGVYPTIQLKGPAGALVIAGALVRSGRKATGGTPPEFKDRESSRPLRDAYRVSECITDRFPSETQSLVMSEVASREETAALAAISDKVRACGETGTEDLGTASKLRGWISLSQYWRGFAPSNPKAAH